MRNTFLIAALMFGLVGLSACSSQTEDLKSPCVGAADSPCVKRTPTNQHA